MTNSNPKAAPTAAGGGARSRDGRVVEDMFERLLFASRWLLAPFFAGLALSLLILLVKFGMEFAHLVTLTLTTSGTELIAEVLGLVDLALMASLLVIVVFSGYENFVSRIDRVDHVDWPVWMGTIDFTGLKLKVLSSIVAISAVQVLRQLMALDRLTDRELAWSVGILIAFVVSTVLLALSDRLGGTPGSADHGAPSRPDEPPAT